MTGALKTKVSAQVGAESSGAAERANQAYQDSNKSSDKKNDALQQHLETLVDMSFSEDQGPPATRLTDAVKKLEMLQSSLPTQEQRQVVDRVLEGLHKVSPDQLLQASQRQAWFASLFSPQPLGAGLETLQTQAATSFRPKENPFAPKRLDGATSSSLHFSNHSKQETPESDSEDFFNSLKRKINRWISRH